jgi:hypothetical protein
MPLPLPEDGARGVKIQSILDYDRGEPFLSKFMKLIRTFYKTELPDRALRPGELEVKHFHDFHFLVKE